MQSLLHNPFAAKTSQQQPSDPSSQSLTSILDHDQRSELTLLVNTILATQRRAITAAFDPRYAGTDSDAQFDSSYKIPTPKDVTGAETEKTSLNAAQLQGLKSKDVGDKQGVQDDAQREEELEKQRRDAEDRIKELSRPEMQELKQAAVKFFDDWRDTVLIRVGEVVNSREEAKAQVNTVTPAEKHDDSSSKKISADSEKKATDSSGNEALITAISRLYPAISTPLTSLSEEKRRLILHSVLLLLLSLEHYVSHSRILLLHLTTSLNLPISFLSEDEANVAQTLLKAAEEMTAEDSRKKHEDASATSKKWKVGLAAVAGAAVIGITGGLAAPLVAGGIGMVMGGLGLEATVAAAYLGTLASSTVVVGGLFGAYGGRMTGKMMEAYAKEVSDFGFVPVHKAHKLAKVGGGPGEKDYRRLRVAIGISGWLTDKDEVIRPWRVLDPTIEAFALRFELEALLSLGNALSILLKSTAWAYAKKEVIKRTLLAGLTEALWPLAILRIGRVIDNPYSIAKLRADKAGLVLADALINRAQGERPVTLVGYSMGARVIYSCLSSLADRKAFGLVENAVLLGTPAPASSLEWRKMRSVVSGRLVNIYSSNDYVLAFLYRGTSIQLGVAGLQAADYVKGVENVDVSEIVDGHLRYRFLTGSILKKIGFEDLDLTLIAEEEDEMRVVEEMERKEKERQGEGSGEEGDEAAAEKEAQRMEKEVKERNEQGMLGWATEKMNLGMGATTAFFTGKKDAGLGQGQKGHGGVGSGAAL